MTLYNVRLELGRTDGAPQGDPHHGYEFVAPLDGDGHLDAGEWSRHKARCTVRGFRPGAHDRFGQLRHLGQGWRFDYDPQAREDDEPFFKLDRHRIAPGLYVSITEEDGAQRPFKIVTVAPIEVAA